MKNKAIISTAKKTLGDFAPAFVKYTDEVLLGDSFLKLLKKFFLNNAA